ncbi:EPIDERMAL PATTERNING FACTOR-like protein 2 [Primulina huaijiensis]|uniref:EPIDERMAL PATTERNING FACTOR-like protein 2 n=1 Tax=Primulina huaijiensis TaxID=1492673 RepID=UPI003CC7742F
MGHSHSHSHSHSQSQSQIPICRYKFRHFLAMYFLILLISTLEGRIPSPNADNKKIVNEEKLSTLRPQIGSRPPRCEGRCSSRVHCVAIQVPSNPQSRSKIKNSPELSAAAYARDDYNSNYKPMNWKCKCGNLIFNP